MKFKPFLLGFTFVAELPVLYFVGYNVLIKQARDETIFQGNVSATSHQTWTGGSTVQVEHELTEQQQKHVYQYVAPGDSTVIGKVFQLDKKTTLLVQDFLKEKTFKT